MRNTLLAVVTAAGLVGCVGGIDNGSPTPPDNGSNDNGSNDNGSNGSNDGPTDPGTVVGSAQSKQLFDTNIYPLLQTKCMSCHNATSPLSGAPGFVAPAATDGYTTAKNSTQLIGDLTPAGAHILTTIAAGHNAVAYSQTDITNITNWLAAETAARAGGAPGTVDLLSQFSGCMTQTDFDTAKMTDWATMQVNNGTRGTCGSCHDNRQYNQIATTVPTKFFTFISTDAIAMSQYFTLDSATAPTKVIINQQHLLDVATPSPAFTGHGQFNLTNSKGMAALTKFYAAATAKLAAGTCGPATLK
jgi:hypothetical protein